MPSSAEGQVVSEQGVVCGAHLPEEAPPFGRGESLLPYVALSSRSFFSSSIFVPAETFQPKHPRINALMLQL